MFQKLYGAAEKRIGFWHAIIFVLIIAACFEVFELKFFFRGVRFDNLFVFFPLLIPLIQLLTFAVAHLVVIFLAAAVFKLTPNMHKYYTMLVFNFALFSLAFVFVALAFYGQALIATELVPHPEIEGAYLMPSPPFLNSILYGLILVFSLIAFIVLIAFNTAFNLILLKKVFSANIGRALVTYLAILLLALVLYALNPFGLLLYIGYMAG